MMTEANPETNEQTHRAEAPDDAHFDPKQVRVLGCLMEKQLTTPDNYPLTLNALTLACNQKTNRFPSMNLTQGEVGNLTNRLADDGEIRINHSSRASKYSHSLRGNLNLDRDQQAVLCILMLREPLTLSEIAARTARMTDFTDTDEIKAVLDNLIHRATPLVSCIPASAGQREDRYTHLLCGADALPDVPQKNSDSIAATETTSKPLSERVDALEKRVAELEELIVDLLK